MAKKRRSRDKVNKKDYDLLKPIDVFSLGSDDDPCFGRHHDLLARECKACGDSEFCAIANAQYLKSKNVEMETEQRFKDIEEADNTRAKKINKAMESIAEYREKGLKKFKILIKVSEEYNLTKEEVKHLLNK